MQAIRERCEALKASKMRIFVRRGGPNYQAGLDMMRRLGDELGIPIEVCVCVYGGVCVWVAVGVGQWVVGVCSWVNLHGTGVRGLIGWVDYMVWAFGRAA